MSAKMCFLFFSITFMVIYENVCDESCTLLINEVNTGSPERFKKTDFIELKMICDSDNSKPKTKSLQGYKIIGMSAGAGKSENTQQMTIDFVVNLWNSKINEQNMFTIGTEDVTNTDMNFNSAYVAYRFYPPQIFFTYNLPPPENGTYILPPLPLQQENFAFDPPLKKKSVLMSECERLKKHHNLLQINHLFAIFELRSRYEFCVV